MKVELQVVLYGLYLVWNMGFKYVEVELDSKARLAFLKSMERRNVKYINVLK